MLLGITEFYNITEMPLHCQNSITVCKGIVTL